MEKLNFSIDKLISLKADENLKNIYDVYLNNFQELKTKFHSIECHLVLYPYNRKVTSKNFKFMPYEEYVNDLTQSQKSIYVKIIEKAPRTFGLFLAIVIFTAFVLFYPAGFISIEAIVAIFGAYTIGKEIWPDIENSIVKATRKSKIQYVENYYNYQYENSTLTKYSNLAKRERYSVAAILPQKLEFIEQSNSQTVRLKLYSASFKNLLENQVRILSIHVDNNILDVFNNPGFLFGVKFIFNTKKSIFIKAYELYQSIHLHTLGCLDKNEKWNNNSVFLRKALNMGKIKFIRKEETIENIKMINYSNILKIN